MTRPNPTWRSVWPAHQDDVVDITTLASRINTALESFGISPADDGVDPATLRYWRRPNVDILPAPIHEHGGYNREHFTLGTLARVRSKVLFASLTETRAHLGLLTPTEVDQELDRLAARQGPRRLAEAPPQPTEDRRVLSLGSDGIELILPATHRAWRDGRARRALLQRIGRALAEGPQPLATSPSASASRAAGRA